MKILVIFLTFLSLNLFAQKDTTNVSALDSINGIYIPKSLEDCFRVLNNLLTDSVKQKFSKMDEDDAISSAHFGLGMWIRNNWGLWRKSRLNLYFNEMQIYHPDDISGIILRSYHKKLNNKDIGLEEQVRIYFQYWKNMNESDKAEEESVKLKEKNILNWLKKKHIKLNTLPKAKDIIYTCDSALLIKQVKGDTITIWTEGGISYMDTVEIEKWLTEDWFGKTSYISGINYQGSISCVSLTPKTFYTSNDSLFELETFYSLPDDTIQSLMVKSVLDFEDTIKRDSIEQIINKNTFKKFKLIFHPNLFTNGIFKGNIKGDIIELNSKWKINNKFYYQINIKNNSGKYETEYSYLFDQKYKLLKYDGCNKDEIDLLIDKYKIK